MRLPPFRDLLLPTVAAVTGVVITLSLAHLQHHRAHATAERRFEHLAQKVADRLEERLNHYSLGLYGTRGLMVASDHVSRDEFRRMIRSRDLKGQFPGALGYGFIRRVRRADLARFLADARADDKRDFTVRTSGTHDELYIIQYIEPVERNGAAVGYDIGSESNRRAAADRAMRSGNPVLTAPIELVQERSRTGFLYLMPVYDGDQRPATEAERVARCVGWVYAPLVIDEVMDGVTEVADGMAELHVHDVTDGGTRLLYDSNPANDHGDHAPPVAQATIPVDVGERRWHLELASEDPFNRSIEHRTTILILVTGVVMTAMLTTTVVSLQSQRRRAVRLAEQMTASLRAREAESRRLALIASRTDNGVVLTDARGLVEWVNDGFTRLSGYTLDDVRGKKPGSVLQGPETDRATVAYAGRCIREGRGFEIEIVNYTKDGRKYWVQSDIQPIRDEAGNIVHFMGIARNVTEHRNALAAVRTAQQRLDMALTAANEGLWDWNLVDDSVYLNDIWYRMLGYEPRELPMTLQTWKDLCHPDDLPVAIQAIERYLAGEGDRYRCEFRMRTKAGGWKWILNIAEAPEHDAAGKATRLIGVHLDIDEQKRIMTELASAKEAAEQASRSKSEFLANMSHEIRTPMTAILGFTDLLRDEDLTPDERREHLDTIHRNGKHLLTVLNDILDLSKIEAGRMQIEHIETPIATLLHEAVSLMQVHAASKGLSIRLDLCQPLPTVVRTDPVRLRQIVMNLIGNAVKFTETGGVSIRAACETTDGRRQLVIAVTDTGIGMDAAQLGRLFQPFMQGDTSTTRKFGGTGLGLTISQRLAHALGGQITVQSQPGRGSTFTVTLDAGVATPATIPVTQTAAVTSPPFQPATGVARLLVCEDGLDNQRLIRHHLVKAGYDVTVADNGRMGVDLASRERFDLILMDMQMPELDGYAATRELRARGCRTPIVALTAHAMADARATCLAAGCDDYAVKPIDRAALLATIRAQLTRPRLRQSA